MEVKTTDESHDRSAEHGRLLRKARRGLSWWVVVIPCLSRRPAVKNRSRADRAARPRRASYASDALKRCSQAESAIQVGAWKTNTSSSFHVLMEGREGEGKVSELSVLRTARACGTVQRRLFLVADDTSSSSDQGCRTCLTWLALLLKEDRIARLKLHQPWTHAVVSASQVARGVMHDLAPK